MADPGLPRHAAGKKELRHGEKKVAPKKSGTQPSTLCAFFFLFFWGGPYFSCHNYIAHNYMGHDSMGHDCMGHDYMGHDYMGHDCMGHDFMGHDYMGHDYMGHDYMGRDYMGHNCIVFFPDPYFSCAAERCVLASIPLHMASWNGHGPECGSIFSNCSAHADGERRGARSGSER